MPSTEKQCSVKKSRIPWAYSPKVVRTNEIVRLVRITYLSQIVRHVHIAIGLCYRLSMNVRTLFVAYILFRAKLYSVSIEIFRSRRRRQPEVGLKTSISQEWCMGSLSDWQE